MYIAKMDNNNLNFNSLRIKIKGAEFEKHQKDIQLIRDEILNNDGIKRFFSNHRGKITVTSEQVPVKVRYDYPRVLRKVPSTPYALPCDQFELEKQVPTIKIDCSYSRAFALRNLFRKPVWMNAGTKPNAKTTWEECIEDTLRLIKMLGNDTKEDMLRRGDTKLRDFHHVEERRLQVEKP